MSKSVAYSFMEDFGGSGLESDDLGSHLSKAQQYKLGWLSQHAVTVHSTTVSADRVLEPSNCSPRSRMAARNAATALDYENPRNYWNMCRKKRVRGRRYDNPNLHPPRARDRRRARSASEERSKPAVTRALDGFLLLEACRVDFPDEAVTADLHGMGLASVVAEDLPFFSTLQVVNAGDNALQLEDFAALPSVAELRMHCNRITTIEPTAALKRFDALQVLDLSFNSLSADSILSLARLPSLRVLDLSSNALESLPEDMSSLRSLERLNASRNHLRSSQAFKALGTLPALADLALAHNGIKEVSEDAMVAEESFPCLEVLDLAYNAISTQHHIAPLVQLRKLNCVLLYGNPLAGSEGSDVRGSCVSKLKEVAMQVRDGWNAVTLEFVTDRPRKRTKARPVIRPGLEADRGRAGNPYKGIQLATVEEMGAGVPTAAEFKAAGNEVLFMDLIDPSLDKPTYKFEPPSTPDRDSDARRTFITGLHALGQLPTEHESAERGDSEDQTVPNLIVRRPIHPGKKADPAKLQTALKALRFALKHGMTSHYDDDAYDVRHREASRPIDRLNATAAARQMPRIPFKHKPSKSFFGMMAARNNREQQNLATLEGVLDSMNAQMTKVVEDDSDVLKNPSQRDHGALKEFGMKKLIQLVNEFVTELEVPARVPPELSATRRLAQIALQQPTSSQTRSPMSQGAVGGEAK